MKIAVLGSAFNPPTLGHKDVIKQCLDANCFDEILLVPSIAHVFGKKMAPFVDRVSWLELFLSDLNADKLFNPANTRLSINLCEQRLFANANNEGTVCTYDVLNFLKNDYEKKYLDAVSLFFVIGPDNVKNLAKFKYAKELQETFDFFIAKDKTNIRSTTLRTALDAKDDISAFTTESVMAKLIKWKRN